MALRKLQKGIQYDDMAPHLWLEECWTFQNPPSIFLKFCSAGAATGNAL